jgi:hypothetical protein
METYRINAEAAMLIRNAFLKLGAETMWNREKGRESMPPCRLPACTLVCASGFSEKFPPLLSRQ